MATACAAAMLSAGACSAEPNDEERSGGDCGGQGTVVVPHIKYGTNADKAVRILESTGLVGVKPDVNFPYYVIGTRPKAGSVVEACTPVELIPGDG
jgi:hypothetical protein